MLLSLISRLSIICAILTLSLVTPVTNAASALYVESPEILVNKIHQIDPSTSGNPGELKTATAAYFGASFYQSLISGNLVLASEGRMQDGSPATYGCGTSSVYTGFDVATNPKWNLFRLQRSSVILLIQRGHPDSTTVTSCPFDRKVFNAQQADGGVVAVIIYDPITTDNIRMVDQGLGPQIRIPSFFLNKKYNDPAYPTENVLAKFVADTSLPNAWLTEMSLEFYLPNPDGDVELAYWHHVADDDIVPFVTTFGDVARAMPGQLLIQPRPFFFQNSDCGNSECGTNCLQQTSTSNVYYCSKKQSVPSKFGDVSGSDIMRETLRQMCIYDKLTNITDISSYDRNINSLWMWRYWEFFYQLDPTLPNPLTPNDWKDRNNVRFNIIWKSLQALGLKDVTAASVQQCMDTATGGTWAIFQNMLNQWSSSGPAGRLSLYINENEYYGTPRCATPITQATCGILSGICYGFANTTTPNACLQSQSCPFGSSSCGSVTNVDNSVLGVSAGAVVGIVIAFMIVTGVVVWIYLRYYKKSMRADVDVLLQQYLPSDTHGSRSSMSHVRQAQEKRLLTEMELEDQALETRGL